jgi:hypothetical protein
MTVDFSLFQLAILGFFTGMGTTFGTESAKLLFEKAKRKIDKKEVK